MKNLAMSVIHTSILLAIVTLLLVGFFFLLLLGSRCKYSIQILELAFNFN